MGSARSIGSGMISFSLVSIPFKVYVAASAKSVSFNMLHKPCSCRVKQQLFCPTCAVVVDRNDCDRGFEYARDQYAKFTNEELQALEAARPSVLELREFVPANTFESEDIEQSYYLGPDTGGERAYRLLTEALIKTQRIAVGRFAKRGKDNLVALRAKTVIKNGSIVQGLVLNECYYDEERRSLADIDMGRPVSDFKPGELEMAIQLIRQLEGNTYDPSKYRDTWRDKVEEAVNQKRDGQELIVQPAQQATILDLMEALQRSIAENEDRRAASEPSSGAPAVSTVKGPKKASPRAEADTAKRRKKT